ncbi:hypothetical protein GXW82_15910 [Streptacidiphilus sp. 4-A2]|nr:hypothetical protein [Streptacidiphilus sp. 4-A2]
MALLTLHSRSAQTAAQAPTSAPAPTQAPAQVDEPREPRAGERAGRSPARRGRTRLPAGVAAVLLYAAAVALMTNHHLFQSIAGVALAVLGWAATGRLTMGRQRRPAARPGRSRPDGAPAADHAALSGQATLPGRAALPGQAPVAEQAPAAVPGAAPGER